MLNTLSSACSEEIVLWVSFYYHWLFRTILPRQVPLCTGIAKLWSWLTVLWEQGGDLGFERTINDVPACRFPKSIGRFGGSLVAFQYGNLVEIHGGTCLVCVDRGIFLRVT